VTVLPVTSVFRAESQSSHRTCCRETENGESLSDGPDTGAAVARSELPVTARE
jgi:hypothetical protein